MERSARLGEASLSRLKEFQSGCDAVGDVRGRGLMFGVELVKDRDSREPDRELAEKVYYRCMENGLSFKISAGNVLTLSPPLTIPEEDLDAALTIVERAITDELAAT